MPRDVGIDIVARVEIVAVCDVCGRLRISAAAAFI